MARRADESRLWYWVIAGTAVHSAAFLGTTLLPGSRAPELGQQRPTSTFALGGHQTVIAEIDLWTSPSPLARRGTGLELALETSPPKRHPRVQARKDEPQPVEIGVTTTSGSFVSESTNEPVVNAAPSESAPSRAPMDLGVNGTTYWVVGPELQHAFSNDKYREAETKLNQYLARETLKSDSLTSYSLMSSARKALLDVGRTLPLQGTRVVVRFVVTTRGTVDSIDVLTRGGLQPQLVGVLIDRLGSQGVAHRPSRPIEYTFELTDATRMPSGRSVGIRLSLAGVGIGNAGAPDSPNVELVPPKWKWERPRKLSRDGSQLEQDPERPIHVEQRLFDTGIDPADILGDARRELRARLISSKVL